MTDKSEPAFPTKMPIIHDAANVFSGMFLRDYFAGQALIGLTPQLSVGDPYYNSLTSKVVRIAYEVADAMLKEREKSNGQ